MAPGSYEAFFRVGVAHANLLDALLTKMLGGPGTSTEERFLVQSLQSIGLSDDEARRVAASPLDRIENVEKRAKEGQDGDTSVWLIDLGGLAQKTAKQLPNVQQPLLANWRNASSFTSPPSTSSPSPATPSRLFPAAEATSPSISIVLNIAEGCGKFSRGDKRRYYLSALGSTTECAAIFDIALRIKVVAVERHREGKMALDRIAAMLTGLAKSMEKRPEQKGAGEGEGEGEGRSRRPEQKGEGRSRRPNHKQRGGGRNRGRPTGRRA